MSLGWSGSGVGLKVMIPGSVQLVGRNYQGAGPGVRSLHHPRSQAGDVGVVSTQGSGSCRHGES